jgi:hypothetical protein
MKRFVTFMLLAASFSLGADSSSSHHKSSSSSSSHCSCSSSEFRPYPGGERCRGRSLPPWIEHEDGAFVYQVNVFNMAEDTVSMDLLKDMLSSIKKDITSHMKKNYGVAIDIKLFCGDRVKDPKLFEGDRIPFFIVDTEGTGAFHDLQASEPANSQSFIWAGASILDTLGIEVPFNFPNWTPYGSVSVPDMITFAQFNDANDNPYGIRDFRQLLCYSINHEFKEIMTDDSAQNWTTFDTFAPTVANWHYAEFDANGVVTNGTVGPDGFVHLPRFLDVFPAGGLLTELQEIADPVSYIIASEVNSYKVEDWSMTNYVNSNYWRGYYVQDCLMWNPKSIKWDRKGYVEDPLQPFGGAQESLIFLDFNTGTSSFGGVVNYGPVTYSQRGDVVQNNFPPDYTFVFFDFNFNPTSSKNSFNKLLKKASELTVKRPKK